MGDALFFYRDAQAAEEFLQKLAAKGAHFGKEGSAAGCLVIEYNNKPMLVLGSELASSKPTAVA